MSVFNWMADLLGFEAPSVIELLFVACAVLGAFFFIIMMALMLIGDIFGGVVDSAFDTDISMDSSLAFELFSLQGIAAGVMMFGLMGYLGITLNITTSLMTCILVGVGVDYTVHFLWHLRDHLRDGDSFDNAIANTFKISGRGILFNGLSVVMGFSALLFSVFVPVRIFGILIMGSISFCLFGALATLLEHF